MQCVEVVDKRVLGSAIDVLARIQAYCTRMVLSRHVLSLAEQRWGWFRRAGRGGRWRASSIGVCASRRRRGVARRRCA